MSREVATWRDEQPSKGEKFWYAATGQLAVVEYNADQVWTGNPANWDRWVGYSYTPDMLNRSSVNDNGTITNYSVSPLNQYSAVNGETVYYDGSFNVYMHGGWFYSYDAQNRLTTVRDWTGALLLQNTYDGLGRCVKRDRHDWGTFVELIAYDGWKPVVEWDGAGNFQAWNVYGPGADEILWRYQSGIGHVRYHYDMHGNVSALLDWWGNIVEKYSYDAFGRPTVTNSDGSGARTWSNWGNRFMFTGREYFPGLWLYDYRNRWYDPQLGRFLQTDPTGFDAGDMNLYRYCDDDPVNRSDPSGLWADPVYTGGFNWWDIGASPASSAASNNNSHPAGIIMAAISLDDEEAKGGGGGGSGSGSGKEAKGDIKVTGGFRDLATMKDAAVRKDYAQIDKSGIGGKDRFEYGGYYLQRKDIHGHTEYGYSGPYQGQQGRVMDKYRKMREANFLVLYGPGALPVPQGWTKIGWHYAHVIPGNTIPNDDKAVARDYHCIVGGAAPPLHRGIFYDPSLPMIEYYP